MITFIIVSLLCFMVCIIIVKKKPMDDFFDHYLFPLFVSILIGITVPLLIGATLPQKEKIIEQEICSINDNSMEFLKVSYIDEKKVYQYMINTEKGKVIKEIDANNVFLGESNLPKIRKHEYVFQKEWYCLIAFDCLNNDYTEILIPKDAKIIQ